MAFSLKTRFGQSLIEIALVMGLSAVFLPALLSGLVAARLGRAQSLQRTEATALLQEAQEAVRVVRENSWSGVAATGTFHPQIENNTWSLESGAEPVSGYTRAIVIENVSRDDSGSIVTTGGTVDPSTQKVTISVTWSTPFTSSVTSTQYLTRYLDNLAHIETTQATFDLGTKSNVATTNVLGGEIVLSGGGHGDWCQPDLTLAQVNLPKSGVANALTAIPATQTVPGYAFAGTGDNASGVSFAKVNITDTDPPTAEIPTPGTFDGFKTNGVFGEAQYAYLATDNNTKEIEIINLQTDPYQEAGYFNAPGNSDGDTVFVSGSIGFMTVGNTLYTFDLSSKSGSRSELDSLSLAGSATKIQVNGSYAYISMTSSATPLQVIDVSDPANLSVIAQAVNLNGKGATDVFVNSTSTRAYLVTSNSPTNPEIFVIDISTKSGNLSVKASADAGVMSPKGVVAVTNNKVVVVGTSGTEYQVFTYDDSSPSLTTCGSGLNVDSGINGVATVIQPGGGAYSYIITGDASSEFKIIEGGPSGSASDSGTYTSAPFDAGISTAFNRFSYSAIIPSDTGIQFQVSGSDTQSDCSQAQFVYQDLPQNGIIPFDNDGIGYENPARCFSYKAILTSNDLSSSPTLQDVTINYSP